MYLNFLIHLILSSILCLIILKLIKLYSLSQLYPLIVFRMCLFYLFKNQSINSFLFNFLLFLIQFKSLFWSYIFSFWNSIEIASGHLIYLKTWGSFIIKVIKISTLTLRWRSIFFSSFLKTNIFDKCLFEADSWVIIKFKFLILFLHLILKNSMVLNFLLSFYLSSCSVLIHSYEVIWDSLTIHK